jgi:hypothetical protein
MKNFLVLFAVLLLVSFSSVQFAQDKTTNTQVESGNWSAATGSTGFTLDKNSGDRAMTIEVNFVKPFNTKPKVILSVTQLDADKAFNSRYSVEVMSVSRDGFTIKVRTWADSKIYAISGNWLAYAE